MKPIYRVLWLAILTAHATAAVVWWWQAPAGSPWRETHFWMNQIMPWAVVAIVIAARIAMYRRPTLAAALLMTIPTAWIAAAIAGRIIFPISFRVLWFGPLVVGMFFTVLWIASTRTIIQRRHPLIWISGAVAIAIGIFTPFSQRAAAPGTRPLNAPVLSRETLRAPEDQHSIRLNDGVQVQPGEAFVNFNADRYTLGIQPVFAFISRSPDRCWTLFAPADLRNGTRREFIGIAQDDHSVALAYRDDCESTLRVEAGSATITTIESSTKLQETIYTHLNTFSELTMIGHHRLFLTFSPCPDQPIEVTFMEYPRGRPERLAYLGADGLFRVVEATSAEKGPYHQLASGRLNRSDRLTITLSDDERPMFRITFDDWAAQSSGALSPTAGYGLPENAIEFSLANSSPSSMAGIYMTLAATSAGRGYNSVGHAAGVYRNRMRVERMVP